VSRQEYETAIALEKSSSASVEAAKASVRRAEVDLGYTRITAPDTGLIGKTEVQAGTLVGRGDPTLLTRISKVDPIHVRFTIAEKDYLRIARTKGAHEEEPGAAKQPLEMFLADGTRHAEPGEFIFIDRNVDPETGTILIEAAFPNPGDLLRPGLYASVRAAVSVRKDAILVPQRAVQESQGVFNVAVVKPDDTIELRPVRTAERVGSLWVIASGLEPDERIVVEGLQKVRPGVKVSPRPVTIEDETAPPADAPDA
jgi:membrane fusion protein (multidrug efflux system)